MRRAEIVEVQGSASGSSREIQELEDAGSKYDSQLQQALREIGDLAPVNEDSEGEITRLTEQVEALKKRTEPNERRVRS
jgi:predicted  nucleic acid-binding Zn-ribbon protein